MILLVELYGVTQAGPSSQAKADEESQQDVLTGIEQLQAAQPVEHQPPEGQADVDQATGYKSDESYAAEDKSAGGQTADDKSAGGQAAEGQTADTFAVEGQEAHPGPKKRPAVEAGKSNVKKAKMARPGPWVDETSPHTPSFSSGSLARVKANRKTATKKDVPKGRSVAAYRSPALPAKVQAIFL